MNVTERVMLSPSQREVLERTAARGSLSLYGARQPTLDILKAKGFLAQEHAIREEYEREVKRRDRDEFIERAKGSLAAGDWKRAHAALEFAYGCERDLDAMAYWITEAGRDAAKGK